MQSCKIHKYYYVDEHHMHVAKIEYFILAQNFLLDIHGIVTVYL